MKKLKKILTMAISVAIVFGSFSAVADQPISFADAYVLGDVTEDGTVTASDALSVKKFLAGTLKKIDYTLGDVNCNSVITTKDLLIYQQYLAGKIESFDEKYLGVPKLSSIENLAATPIDMGSVAHNMYSEASISDYHARNVWDMQVFDDKIFFGTGNYGDNIAAYAGVYYIDKNMSKTKLSKQLSSEQISRFHVIDGKLFTAAADPKAWMTGSYYCYDYSSPSTSIKSWKEYKTLTNNIHCYDMVEYDGKVFFAGPNYTDQSGYGNVYLSDIAYIDKDDMCTDKPSTLVDMVMTVTDSHSRVRDVKLNKSSIYRTYDMFVFDGDLYATMRKNSTYKNTYYILPEDKAKQVGFELVMSHELSSYFPDIDKSTLPSCTFSPDGVYKYDKKEGVFRYIEGSINYSTNVFAVDQLRGYEYVSRGFVEGEYRLNSKFEHDGAMYLCDYDIFKTTDFKTYTKVSLGSGYENYLIRDHIEVDGIHYFVASEKTSDMRYNNVVLSTTDFKSFKRVLYFKTNAFIRSFEYLNGSMYFTLGAYYKEYDTTGKALTSNPYPDRYNLLGTTSSSTKYVVNRAIGKLLRVDFYEE